MASQHGKQIIAIHILPNTATSKGNQAIKFGQLIEYNMKNTKCSEEIIVRPFSKKLNIEQLTSGSIVERFIQFVAIVCQVEGYRNILKLSYRPLSFISYKAFL